MTRTRGTHMQTELASYSRDFYRDLAALSGVDVGYYPNGSLSVARTPERLTELRYALTLAHHHGLPARELAREEIAAVSPLLAVDDLAGGVLFEEDATVNPGWAAFATAKAAQDLGVRFVEGAGVTGFVLDRGPAGLARVSGVQTAAATSSAKSSCWRPGSGRTTSRCSPARACRCTRPSTTGRRRSRWTGRRATCPSSATSTARSTCATTAAASSSARSSRTGVPAPRPRSRRTSRSASSSRTWSTSGARWPAPASGCRRWSGALHALPVRARELHARRQLRPRRDR